MNHSIKSVSGLPVLFKYTFLDSTGNGEESEEEEMLLKDMLQFIFVGKFLRTGQVLFSKINLTQNPPPSVRTETEL